MIRKYRPNVWCQWPLTWFAHTHTPCENIHRALLYTYCRCKTLVWHQTIFNLVLLSRSTFGMNFLYLINCACTRRNKTRASTRRRSGVGVVSSPHNNKKNKQTQSISHGIYDGKLYIVCVRVVDVSMCRSMRWSPTSGHLISFRRGGKRFHITTTLISNRKLKGDQGRYGDYNTVHIVHI